MIWILYFVFIFMVHQENVISVSATDTITCICPVTPGPFAAPFSLFASPIAITPVPFDAVKDADTLLKSQDHDKALLDIFPKRDHKQRQQIIAEYNKMSPDNPFFPKDYKLLSKDLITDLKYAMSLNIPQDLVTEYLYSCLEVKDSYWWGPLITTILSLADLDRPSILRFYDQRFRKTVDEGVDKQGGDYRNFVRELLGKTREYDSMPYRDEDLDYWADEIDDECDEWKDDREDLDNFLIRNSKAMIKRALPVVEKKLGSTFNEAIDKNIEDVNLKTGYKFLVEFALNPAEAIANRIFNAQSDPNDHGATKVALIVAYSETVLSDVNIAFFNKHKKTLSQFLSDSQMIVDKILAALVDRVTAKESSSAALDSPASPSPVPFS